MLNANLLLIILPLGLVGILQKRTTPKTSRVSVQNANFSDPGIFRIRVLTLYSISKGIRLRIIIMLSWVAFQSVPGSIIQMNMIVGL
jgi:hypothetical protein